MRQCVCGLVLCCYRQQDAMQRITTIPVCSSLTRPPSVDFPSLPLFFPLHSPCLSSFISRSLSRCLSSCLHPHCGSCFPSTCLPSRFSVSSSLPVVDRWRHAGGVKDQHRHKQANSSDNIIKQHHIKRDLKPVCSSTGLFESCVRIEWIEKRACLTSNNSNNSIQIVVIHVSVSLTLSMQSQLLLFF